MTNVYEAVTARIIAELEKGAAPWVKPWKGSGVAELPYNAASSRRYNGVNILLLWEAAMEHEYRLASWLTFVQAKQLGGNVSKGERAVPIVFAKNIIKTGENEGSDKENNYRLLKFHSVFNVEQVDGLPERCYGVPAAKPLSDALIEVQEFTQTGRNDSSWWQCRCLFAVAGCNPHAPSRAVRE